MPKGLTRAAWLYLQVAQFLAGMAALALEVVGARLISPYYGSSTYAWSAQISVALMAIAIGYKWGGLMADREARLAGFARLVMAAAVLIALIPPLRIPVLKGTTFLGLGWGALASTLALNAPALCLLSSLAPIAVRLRVGDLSRVGSGAGDVYALSTLGGVAGAVACGFFLIPCFGISSILYGMSILLACVALAGYALLGQRPSPALWFAALAAAFLRWPLDLPAGVNVVFRKESPYGQIKVVDSGKSRFLMINGILASERSDCPYPALEWAALLRPGARRALVIGVGAGQLSGVLERHYGLSVEDVDIDPVVVSAAQTYFGFRPSRPVSIEDGRAYLELGESRYDIVVMDAFRESTPPFHLFTKEAFEAVRRRLEPDGVIGINIMARPYDEKDRAWRSVYKTLGAVFPHVRAFSENVAPGKSGNVFLFASGMPLDDDGVSRKARPVIKTLLTAILARELRPTSQDLSAATLMTDDFAPMEWLTERTSDDMRAAMLAKQAYAVLY